MERDQGYPPAARDAEPGYERAMQRLEAALDLALGDGRTRGPAADVRWHLDAARTEIGRIRANRGLRDGDSDVTLATKLARRITEDPRLSLTSQKARGALALKSLLND